MNFKNVLGIDIGGTYIRMGIVDNQYQLSQFKIIKTGTVFTDNNPAEKLIECIKNYQKELSKDEFPHAISIGLPSTIDSTRKIVVNTPNIKNLQDIQYIPIVDLVEKAFCLPVYLNRDVNSLFIYDMETCDIAKDGIILGFYFGTGIGNAISVNGRLILGKNGVAAELGHIPVLGANDLCGCGNRGCIETFASGKYLKKIKETKFPNTHISNIFTFHGADQDIIAFVDHMSIPIATEINIFDPDYIIIGGGIINMENYPIELLEKNIHNHIRKPYPDQNIVIFYSSPAQENGVIGAGIYAFKRFSDVCK